MTRIFPLLVAVLEGCAGLVYLGAWWAYGAERHGWLAVVWIFYSLAAFGLAMAGE
jgi:hypothetical protein